MRTPQLAAPAGHSAAPPADLSPGAVTRPWPQGRRSADAGMDGEVTSVRRGGGDVRAGARLRPPGRSHRPPAATGRSAPPCIAAQRHAHTVACCSGRAHRRATCRPGAWCSHPTVAADAGMDGEVTSVAARGMGHRLGAGEIDRTLQTQTCGHAIADSGGVPIAKHGSPELRDRGGAHRLHAHAPAVHACTARRPHVPPHIPRHTQLPASPPCHRPHVSAHDASPRGSAARSRPHIPRPTQLPASPPCHKPHVSAHDASPRGSAARSRPGSPRAHPARRTLRSHHRRRLGLLCVSRTAVASHGLQLPRNCRP